VGANGEVAGSQRRVTYERGRHRGSTPGVPVVSRPTMAESEQLTVGSSHGERATVSRGKQARVATAPRALSTIQHRGRMEACQ
jgi:hypothetical protein